MNREEFILTLRKELSKLPPEEIVEATQYFEEIFDEATAGLDDEERLAEEQKLVTEFGNPKKIAAQVKADYAARLLEGEETVEGKKPGTGKKLSAVWWVIIGICSAPVSIPLAICVVTIAITIIAAIISLYAGIVSAAISGITVVIAGFACLPGSVASGVMTIGAGLMILAASVAAGFGAFLGTKVLITALARKLRTANKNRKINKLAGESEKVDDWAFTGEVQEDEALPEHADENERGTE